MVSVKLEGVEEIRRRFLLTEAEFDKAFSIARRKAIGAGLSRVFRQLKAISSDGRPVWVGRRRVFGGPDRTTGAARIWVGLNPTVRGGRKRRARETVDLSEFDPEPVADVMIRVWDVELEKAAKRIVRG